MNSGINLSLLYYDICSRVPGLQLYSSLPSPDGTLSQQSSTTASGRREDRPDSTHSLRTVDRTGYLQLCDVTNVKSCVTPFSCTVCASIIQYYA